MTKRTELANVGEYTWTKHKSKSKTVTAKDGSATVVNRGDTLGFREISSDKMEVVVATAGTPSFLVSKEKAKLHFGIATAGLEDDSQELVNKISAILNLVYKKGTLQGNIIQYKSSDSRRLNRDESKTLIDQLHRQGYETNEYQHKASGSVTFKTYIEATLYYVAIDGRANIRMEVA